MLKFIRVFFFFLNIRRSNYTYNIIFYLPQEVKLLLEVKQIINATI